MMPVEINYSIVIPHKDAAALLFRLLETIPGDKDVEVIVADDHSSDDTMAQIDGKALAPNVRLILLRGKARGAGAARNAAMKEAKGKWLLFADADDYFLPNLKDKISKHLNDPADLIYFHATSLNTTTGKQSDRHIRFNWMIDSFNEKRTTDTQNKLRCGHTPPWSKMFRRQYLVEHNILFEEVPASNDVMFSILAGHYAKITADDSVLYCVTENAFGLTKTYSKEVWYARLGVALRGNAFLRRHGLAKFQMAVPKVGLKVSLYNFHDACNLLCLLIRYKQNPFCGLYAKCREKAALRKYIAREKHHPDAVAL